MLEGPDTGAIHALGDQAIVLGRGVECTWRLGDGDVSRTHARVYRDGASFFIEDLGSANGTYVHGERVVGRWPLRGGDRIRLGGTVLLRFDTHDAHERDVLAQLYRSAVRDALTGAHNRRYLDERLDGEVSYALRHGEDLALVMLDLDHFKAINDEHGHPVGDVVLRALAAAVQRVLRPEDVLARYGGEEFVVLARGLGPRDACSLAERLRRSIESCRIRTDAGTLSVTVSAGVSLLRHDRAPGAPGRLLSDADDALYRAKHKGRNRVCVTYAGD